MKSKLNVIFKEAEDCKICSTIPTKEVYSKFGIKFPVPYPKQDLELEKIKILFVLESPGIAKGGAAQTGILSDDTNSDKSATNSNKLRELANIKEENCFFTNSILHTVINDNGEMRKPHNSEVKKCHIFLKKIIDFLDPPIIVPMGTMALSALNFIERHPYKKITLCAGKNFIWYNRIAFPLVHCSPKGLLNRDWKLQVEDYKKLKQLLDTII